MKYYKKERYFMDIKRASEIIESLGVIEVSYKGDPVWLENINKQSNTIRVKNMKTEEELNVGIRDLEEI
jgi:small acid-soluble spore protein, H-type